MKSDGVSAEPSATRDTFLVVALGMGAADIAVVVVGILEAGTLNPCRYAGEGAESPTFAVMLVAILATTAAVVALARHTTRSWAIAMAILCVQLSTSTGFAFLPFIVRLSPS